MKKNALLFLILMLFYSCSSSDNLEDNQTQTDPFIGTWHFGNNVYKLTSGGDFIESISSCEAQGYYRFNANGNAEIVSFLDESSECNQEPDNLSSFTWEKLNQNTYRLHSVENDGTQSSSTETVYFENNNTMYWVDVFTSTTTEGDEFNERWSYFNK